VTAEAAVSGRHVSWDPDLLAADFASLKLHGPGDIC
jgi:hypothetical protein